MKEEETKDQSSLFGEFCKRKRPREDHHRRGAGEIEGSSQWEAEDNERRSFEAGQWKEKRRERGKKGELAQIPRTNLQKIASTVGLRRDTGQRWLSTERGDTGSHHLRLFLHRSRSSSLVVKGREGRRFEAHPAQPAPESLHLFPSPFRLFSSPATTTTSLEQHTQAPLDMSSRKASHAGSWYSGSRELKHRSRELRS